ncbi:MAG: Snf7 family protein [Nitrososphaeraceae archaeon]|jgi:division protein CdvB (Snf7/Vps24/ESCRT-III family)|nr:Snf7 family protein [Nitrososphaeraceae archaeon]
MDKHQQQQQFKSDIVNASLVLNNQLTRLRMLDKKFTAMNTDLRNQIAANIKSGNNDRAKAIANELANIRHVQRTTQNMSLALEVVVIRFSTINEFAIILETINPTIEMIKGIQKEISKAVPTANEVLSEMTSMTSDVLINSNIKSEAGKVPISIPVDTEALSILNEVEGILENEAKAKLPEVPNSIHANKIKQETDEHVIEDNRIMVEG